MSDGSLLSIVGAFFEGIYKPYKTTSEFCVLRDSGLRGGDCDCCMPHSCEPQVEKTVRENIFADVEKKGQLTMIALRDFCLYNPTCFLTVEKHMVSVRNLKTKKNMDFEVETQVEEDETLSGKMRVVFCDSCVKFFLPAK